MEKIKEYKLIIVLILAVIGGAFYWYELRPAGIRELCHGTASGVIGRDFKEYNEVYLACLRGYGGLEK